MDYPTTGKIAAYYDRIAAKFHASRLGHGRLFNDHIEKPALIDLMSPIYPEMTILDIGCGSGVYSRLLAEAGAYVTAVDVSKGMLHIAREYCKGLPIDFRLGSFEEIALLPNTFDLVLGSFILGYFWELPRAFTKMRSLLRPEGIVVVSTIHPIRLNSQRENHEAYRMYDYFGGGIYPAIIVEDVEPFPQPKRTISDIIEAAFKASLVVERLLEPVPDLPYSDAQIAFYLRCPSVLALRLRPAR